MRNWLVGGLVFAGAVGAAVPASALLGWCGGIKCGALENATARQFPYTSYDGRFIFARVYYDMGGRGMRGFGGGGREPPWHHDHPYAEQNFTQILRELTFVRPYTDGGNILALDDPRLMLFPVAYMSEPGFWEVNDDEAKALRAYLLKGGFIIFDDFGGGGDGERQMYNLIDQMSRVLPELTFLPLDASDAIFDSFFQFDPETINLVYERHRTQWWGIFLNNDKSKRMLAVAGQHGDLGEFWEYSASGFFPVDMSNEAYKVGVNYIIYAMTH
jgi:hypothetical protein